MERLVQLSRETLGDDLTPREQAGLERFERSIVPRPPRVATRWILRGAMVAGAAALALAAGMRPGTSALGFRVEGGTISDGGYIRQTGAGSASLRFSEGTELTLAAGSRARVTSVDEQGARVLLESGAARVHVTPRPRARWSVDAGPYSIRVTGTAFDVAWAGGEEVLDLSLHHGSVVVTGPLATQGLVMEAGQHLLANVKAGVVRLDRKRADGTEETETVTSAAPAAVEAEAAAEEPVMPETAAEPRPTTRVRRVPAHRMAGHATSAEPPASWRVRLARGEFDAVVADAERRGVDRVLSGASSEDLAALADAARYARKNELARRTLSAELNRFPASAAGRDAPFFLGGLAEEVKSADAAASALGWYERYLRENPRGSYASQALGRKMLMQGRLGDAAGARAVAAEYLQRFPGGPYAERARQLLRDR